MLRDDLKLVPDPETGGCHLIDPANNESYDFGPVEAYLLGQLRAPYQLDSLLSDINRRFALSYRLDDLREFITMLDEWRLMRTTLVSEPISPGQDATPPPDDSEYVSHAADDSMRAPNRWHLFVPEHLLEFLARIFPNLETYAWLSPPLLALAISVVFFNSTNFVADFSSASSQFGTLGRLLVAALLINLAAQLAKGVTARALGLPTPGFGLVLAVGLLPRFNVQIKPAEALTREMRLRLSASPLLARLWVFILATLIWAVAHRSKSMLPMFAVEMAFVAAINLLMTANPLMKGDGASLLSAWLSMQDIHLRSRLALAGWLGNQPATIRRHSRHPVAYALFGILSFALVTALISFVLYRVFSYFESHYRGAGVALFISLSAYVGYAIWRQRSFRKNRMKAGGLARAGDVQSSTENASHVRAKSMRWAGFLLICIVLCLPYQYEVSGTAEVFPAAKVTIAAETDGVVEAVNFKGGESVKTGQVLAQLADYKQTNDLKTVEAEIVSKQNEILRYRTTPSLEEIRLAEEKVATARQQVRYSIEKVQRQGSLLAQGFISSQAFEDTKNALDRDKQALEEAVKSLDSLKAQVNPYQIRQLEADLEKLRQEARFHSEQLRRTRLSAPIDGRIITPDLQNLRNTYLEAGQKFAEIEDARTMLLHVAVPEADAWDVATGASVTLKLWAYPNRDFPGNVDEIDAVATGDGSARSITVKCRFNNADGRLKTGLTGYAKINGENTIVLLAFSRALVRFISVEVWSWLP